MITRILTGIDGSGSSRQALQWACDLALRYQPHLFLIHVLLQGIPLEHLRALAEEGDFIDEIHDDFLLIALAPTAMPNMVGVPPVMTVPRSLLEKFGRSLLFMAEGKAKSYKIKNVSTHLMEGERPCTGDFPASYRMLI